MTICYLNQPNSVKNLHVLNGCHHVDKHGGARHIRVDTTTISSVINRFKAKQVDFKASKGSNDLYLEIDFEDQEFEQAVVIYLINLLALRYSAFKGVVHKCPSCFRQGI
jgi:hypothetical protein